MSATGWGILVSTAWGNVVSEGWGKGLAVYIRIVVGGILPTILGERLLTEFDESGVIDFSVIGDGEETLVELVNSLKSDPAGKRGYGKIAGLIWRGDNNEIVRNAPRPVLENLDSLPFPSRSSAEAILRTQDELGFTNSLRVITSRGCYAKCIFCHISEYYSSTRSKRRWRSRSAANIISEVAKLNREFGVSHFLFSDDNFFGYGAQGKKRVADIIAEIRRNNLDITFHIQARLDTIDLPLLHELVECGLAGLDIGIETISNSSLEFMRKGITVDDVYTRFLEIIRSIRLPVGVYMLNVHPFSSVDETRNNYHFLNELGYFDVTKRDEEVFRKLLLTRLEITKYTRLYYELLDQDLIDMSKTHRNPVRAEFLFVDPKMEHFHNSCVAFVRDNGVNGFDSFLREQVGI